MAARDGHVRVLPLHVANKIAAGEVVERPASVAKELLENALDAGAGTIRLAVTQGGRKFVSVQDDGCGMTRDDAVLALERQATSKILDVTDIESIDTLGFRGEAIPSIASVSRFTLTTRRHEADEGTTVLVNAGTLAGVEAAGCPPGTLVEVRDLFCNVPARRKFLRAYATEEAHVKEVFCTHALAHPSVAFSLTVDGREVYNLPSASTPADRLRDLFGPDFLTAMLPVSATVGSVTVTGFVERPNLAAPTRRDQFIFVNARPATAPAVGYALREAYPRQMREARACVVLFIELPPGQVDVNVHPTKREVRFRDNVAVKAAIEAAVQSALSGAVKVEEAAVAPIAAPIAPSVSASTVAGAETGAPVQRMTHSDPIAPPVRPKPPDPLVAADATQPVRQPVPTAQPLPVELPRMSADGAHAKPWAWFRFLAQSTSGYLLIETDAGLVTINPIAARERIVYERLLAASDASVSAQALLIPETVHLTPVEAVRVEAALDDLRGMGFSIESFGRDTFKIDAVPQAIGTLSPADVITTVAHDLAESGTRRGERWRAEAIARSVARSFAGGSIKIDAAGAERLVEELCACRMPYVCPRGKRVMIFTSTRELNRQFDRG